MGIILKLNWPPRWVSCFFLITTSKPTKRPHSKLGYLALLFLNLRNPGACTWRLKKKKSKNFKIREIWTKRVTSTAVHATMMPLLVNIWKEQNMGGRLALLQLLGPPRETSQIMLHKWLWPFLMTLKTVNHGIVASDTHWLLTTYVTSYWNCTLWAPVLWIAKWKQWCVPPEAFARIQQENASNSGIRHAPNNC